ncbi:BTB/POZ domain-containing protein [Tieghemostelium lacteum]|uniref:BTB/POZ domain-containing protein n=1 Tax=Tieghemostelium lacteum TaxID=361077 RepID=A0A151Z9B5_TIELA|nr:BTB/POZ domain-containing protein [Tieghemostelium lacteum]|eukprot:KYQ90538.1 BTB/POZ domain-containing protein [Tieghemostelium lacteum]
MVSKKLVLPISKIYNEDGGEIDEIDTIIPKETLYASCGEAFINPYPDGPPNNNSSLISLTKDHHYNQQQQHLNNNYKSILGSGSVDSAIHGNEWITINVGGKIFTTTRTTILSRDKDSMLAKMFSENWDSSRDVNGAYLIDRSPEYFEPILNYLRCGTIVVNDFVNVEGVYQEARFFNITGMIEKLSQMVERRNNYHDQFTRKDVISILLTSSSNSSLRCQGLNLAGVDLSKLDLRNINFKMTNFKGTDLSKCNLDNALLQEADLSGANLSGASLRGTNLTGANLEGCNLKGANFEDRGGQRAILENCNFKTALLEEVNFSGANVRVSNFKGANLENCNFRGADLAGANLEDTNLRGANLHKANLIGVNLRGANFDIRTVSSR